MIECGRLKEMFYITTQMQNIPHMSLFNCIKNWFHRDVIFIEH